MYPTLPQININEAFTPIKTNLGQNQALSEILNQVSQFIKPMDRIQDFETYAKPQRAVFQNYVNTNLRPEFDRFTRRPAVNRLKSGMSSAYATGATTGDERRNFADNLAKVDMQIGNQVLDQQTNFDDLIRQFYNKQMATSANSPSAITNIK